MLAATLIPQVLKQHFNKDIASANGIVHAGAYMGTFAFIPIFSYLINTYGISGALLITSGIMLNCIPIAMLLKDPKYNELLITVPANLHNDNCINNICEHFVGHNTVDVNVGRAKLIASNEPDLLSIDSSKYKTTSGRAQVFNVCETIECNKQVGHSQQQLKGVSLPLRSADNSENKTELKTNGRLIEVPVCNEFLKSGRLDKLKNSLKVFQVLTDPSFLLIMVCESLRIYVEAFIVTAVVDISRDKGIAQNMQKYFPMCFVFAETVGYTCLGWVTDKGHVTVPNYTTVCFLCLGISSCSFVFSNSFLTMMTASMISGLASSGIAIVMPVLIYDFVEKSKHDMAIASRILLYAPLSFTIAPIIGKKTLSSFSSWTILYNSL